MAHCSFNILTAEMVNDLNDTFHHKPKLPPKGSKSSPMTHVIDNPLDDFSNSDDQTSHITIGITSSPPFFTKRPKHLLKWHDSNHSQNENKIFISKIITKLRTSFLTSKNSNST